MRTVLQAVILLLASAAPALSEDWLSFPMGEGPDLKVDRSSVKEDSNGTIAPWGKGWMTARTMSEGYGRTSGYFVTNCRDLYDLLYVDPKTGAIEKEKAQPLHIAPGTVAQQIQSIVCGKGK